MMGIFKRILNKNKNPYFIAITRTNCDENEVFHTKIIYIGNVSQEEMPYGMARGVSSDGTIDISLPCEYVKIWASFDYKTVAKFKDGKFSTIKEVDEYDLVEEWLSNRGDELFTIKYTFTFLVLDIDNPERTNEKLELTFDLCLDNNGFSFLNTENNDFSFYDRSSAREFKRYFRMALMESESYIQRIIDNDYFEKLKWESIVTVFDGISLNKLYNKKGITFIDFGLDL